MTFAKFHGISWGFSWDLHGNVMGYSWGCDGPKVPSPSPSGPDVRRRDVRLLQRSSNAFLREKGWGTHDSSLAQNIKRAVISNIVRFCVLYVVGKTIINHPPNQHFYRWYVYHSQMVYYCFNHIIHMIIIDHIDPLHFETEQCNYDVRECPGHVMTTQGTFTSSNNLSLNPKWCH